MCRSSGSFSFPSTTVDLRVVDKFKRLSPGFLSAIPIGSAANGF